MPRKPTIAPITCASTAPTLFTVPVSPPDSTVGGPYIPQARVCRWCSRNIRHVWFDHRYDGYVDADGRTTCTPADRGLTPGAPGSCVFGYYADPRVMGPAVYDKKGQFQH